MAAAVHRSTPASSVNPAEPQVTATVLEFRCMFSHDLFKKQKKWHDGSLRFHTFNKRVMVYDETKNFVGDLHYRQAEEFGEGLELKLDRPVLIQVEEPLGQSKTDLTPLLGRQRQDGGPYSTNQTQPARSTLARINAANSQVKPKSIKELLGASQGKIRRARLPTQSPYEQRQYLSDAHSMNEPVAKRQRVADGKENELTQQVKRLPGPPVRHPPPPKEPTRQVEPLREVMDISSDEDTDAAPRPTRKEIAAPRRVDKVSKNTITKQAADSCKRQVKRTSNTEMRTSSGKERTSQNDVYAQSEDANVKGTLQRPTSASSSVSISSVVASVESHPRVFPGPRSSLKFLSSRPRPKLMYKALLTPTTKPADSSSNISHTHVSHMRVKRRGADKSIHSTRRPHQTDLIDTDNFFATSQVAARSRVSSSARSIGPVQGEIPEEQLPRTLLMDAISLDRDRDASDSTLAADKFASELVPDSPLFMPRNASQLSIVQSQEFVNDDMDFGMLETRPNEASQLSDTPEKSLASQATTESYTQACPNVQDAMLTLPEAEAARSQNHIEETLKPAHHIDHAARGCPEAAEKVPVEQAAAHALCPRSRSKPLFRPFRRVVSEAIPARQTTSDLSDIDENDGGLELSPSAMQGTTSLKAQADLVTGPPAPFRRTTSDPMTLNLITTTVESTDASSEIESEAEQGPEQENDSAVLDQHPNATQRSVPEPLLDEGGPWTSTEAFLLFDWWPPGKQKPDYGQGVSPRPDDPANCRTGNQPVAKNDSVAITALSKKKYGTFGSARLVSQK